MGAGALLEAPAADLAFSLLVIELRKEADNDSGFLLGCILNDYLVYQ